MWSNNWLLNLDVRTSVPNNPGGKVEYIGCYEKNTFSSFKAIASFLESLISC